jgi:hypothetical protein
MMQHEAMTIIRTPKQRPSLRETETTTASAPQRRCYVCFTPDALVRYTKPQLLKGEPAYLLIDGIELGQDDAVDLVPLPDRVVRQRANDDIKHHPLSAHTR